MFPTCLPLRYPVCRKVPPRPLLLLPIFLLSSCYYAVSSPPAHLPLRSRSVPHSLSLSSASVTFTLSAVALSSGEKSWCARGLEYGNRYTEPKQQRPKQRRLRLALCSFARSALPSESSPPPLLSLSLSLSQPFSTACFLPTSPPLPSFSSCLPPSLLASSLESSRVESRELPASSASSCLVAANV
ncbi:hypothetical protein Mapa_013291 [Marchantia paleacea]|nr:hypothetical protein Mapa_013291 [Marchantia paleacea]